MNSKATLFLLPIAVLFVGCARSIPATAQNAEPAKPVFSDGQAQVVPEFENKDEWIREELWVQTDFDSDGDGKMDRVHTSVARQSQTKSEGLKVPVIYGSSPYYSGTSGAREFLWNVKQELGEESPVRTHQPAPTRSTKPFISDAFVDTWVPRGFAVVHSESPGTGLSQGCPTVGGINESLAPKAVIDWLNGRAKAYTSVDGNEEVVADWATGKVGMTGTSYNGTLPLAAATTGVDGLEAIIPVAPNTSYYHYYRSNGLVRHPGGWLGEDIDFLYDFIHSQESDRREYCNQTVRDGEMAAGRDRASGDYNDFWYGRDYINVVDNVKAATLMAHAFNDWNVVPEHSVRIVEKLKANGVPVQMYFHQGGHGGPPPMELMNKWFTRYLYDIANGVENDPKAWIVREGDERENPTPYADYPNPESAPVQMHLVPSPTGPAGLNGVGGLNLDPVGSNEKQSLVDNVSFDGASNADAEWSGSRLLYATPELAEDVHLSGTATVTIRVAANRKAANLSVWLVELPWTNGGRGRPDGVITRGWADPQNHGAPNMKSPRNGKPLVPGEFYNVTFDLQPDDQIVPAGKRIGLMIMSSDKDFTLAPDPGTELTIDVGGTMISLPVVGGREAMRKAMQEAVEG
jgi:X-Pro dipeptidyl-peptidase